MSAVTRLSVVEKPVQKAWVLVTPEAIDSIWELVKPGIENALATSNGEGTAEDTRLGLVAGRTRLMMLWKDGASLGIVFMFLNFPRFKIARVLLLFGENMRLLVDGMNAAETWAKEQGCKLIEGWVATESRQRLFSLYGYKPTYTILRKALT